MGMFESEKEVSVLSSVYGEENLAKEQDMNIWQQNLKNVLAREKWISSVHREEPRFLEIILTIIMEKY